MGMMIMMLEHVTMIMMMKMKMKMLMMAMITMAMLMMRERAGTCYGDDGEEEERAGTCSHDERELAYVTVMMMRLMMLRESWYMLRW